MAAVAVGAMALVVRNGFHPGGPALGMATAAVRGSFVVAESSSDTARMDAQIEILRAMHDKVMAARTRAEGEASMTGRTNAIRNALKVMNETPFGEMRENEGDDSAQWRMMEKRLEMTQIALQLAAGRLAVALPE